MSKKIILLLFTLCLSVQAQNYWWYPPQSNGDWRWAGFDQTNPQAYSDVWVYLDPAYGQVLRGFWKPLSQLDSASVDSVWWSIDFNITSTGLTQGLWSQNPPSGRTNWKFYIEYDTLRFAKGNDVARRLWKFDYGVTHTFAMILSFVKDSAWAYIDGIKVFGDTCTRTSTKDTVLHTTSAFCIGAVAEYSDEIYPKGGTLKGYIDNPVHGVRYNGRDTTLYNPDFNEGWWQQWNCIVQRPVREWNKGIHATVGISTWNGGISTDKDFSDVVPYNRGGIRKDTSKYFFVADSVGLNGVVCHYGTYYQRATENFVAVNPFHPEILMSGGVHDSWGDSSHAISKGLTGYNINTKRFFNADTGFSSLSEFVYDGVWLNDSLFIVSNSRDKKIYIYNYNTDHIGTTIGSIGLPTPQCNLTVFNNRLYTFNNLYFVSWGVGDTGWVYEDTITNVPVSVDHTNSNLYWIDNGYKLVKYLGSGQHDSIASFTGNSTHVIDSLYGGDPAFVRWALYGHGDTLYIGGTFWYLQGKECNGLAMLVNDVVYPMGQGVGGLSGVLYDPNDFVPFVSRMVWWDEMKRLVIAGFYRTMDGRITSQNICMWSPSTGFAPMGYGIDWIVWGLTVGGDGNLYISGDFSSADGLPTNHMAGYYSDDNFTALKPSLRITSTSIAVLLPAQYPPTITVQTYNKNYKPITVTLSYTINDTGSTTKTFTTVDSTLNMYYGSNVLNKTVTFNTASLVAGDTVKWTVTASDGKDSIITRTTVIQNYLYTPVYARTLAYRDTLDLHGIPATDSLIKDIDFEFGKLIDSGYVSATTRSADSIEAYYNFRVHPSIGLADTIRCKHNLLDWADSVTLVGAVTWANANAVTFNGSNGYFSTNFIPRNDSAICKQNSVSFGAYNLTNTNSVMDFGVQSGGSYWELSGRYTDLAFVRINSATGVTPVNTNSIGWVFATRWDSMYVTFNGVRLGATIIDNNTKPDKACFIGGFNNNGALFAGSNRKTFIIEYGAGIKTWFRFYNCVSAIKTHYGL